MSNSIKPMTSGFAFTKQLEPVERIDELALALIDL